MEEVRTLEHSDNPGQYQDTLFALLTESLGIAVTQKSEPDTTSQS